MNLYVARHAWAEDRGDPPHADDSRRPLTAAGVARYRRLLRTIARRGFEPEIVATSPYVRCRQTADLMAAQFGQRPEVVELEALAPGSDLEELCRWSSRARCDAICWVGHAPDVGQLTAALIGSPAGRVRFAKGGMAAVRVDGPLGPSCGELQWLVTAKLLGL